MFVGKARAYPSGAAPMSYRIDGDHVNDDPEDSSSTNFIKLFTTVIYKCS